jgi:hypothetical protein
MAYTKEITLNELHEYLAKAYAVSVNDTLYFVGYEADSGSPYIADNDGNDYVDLSDVDGEIILNFRDSSFFFYVAGEPITLKCLSVTNYDQVN